MWNCIVGTVIELTKDEIFQEVSALCPKYINQEEVFTISSAIYEIIHVDLVFFKEFRMIVADENDLSEERKGFICIYNDSYIDEINIRTEKAKKQTKEEIIRDALFLLM